MDVLQNGSPSHRVDGQFFRSVDQPLLQNFSIRTVEPADFDVVFVREDIGEVEVTSNPVDGDAADAIGPDAVTNDVLQFGAVRSNSEDTVPRTARVEVDPVDPFLGDVHVDVKHMMSWN